MSRAVQSFDWLNQSADCLNQSADCLNQKRLERSSAQRVAIASLGLEGWGVGCGVQGLGFRVWVSKAFDAPSRAPSSAFKPPSSLELSDTQVYEP